MTSSSTCTRLPIDLERPWIGLESFREASREFFFGRDMEIAELALLARCHPLLAFYGRSGLGKTSIIRAGLIPRLRAEGGRPLLLRLRYENSAPELCDQIIEAIFAGQEEQDGSITLNLRTTSSLVWTHRLGESLGIPLPGDPPSRLWLRLHYRAESPSITHLILDQFEEVFTIGMSRLSAEDELRDTLAVLVQGVIPDPISRLITEHDTFLDRFDPDSVPVSVILSLRDDYVYALNRWRRHLPSLGQSNFELRALRGRAAFDAVFKPGQLRCKHGGQVDIGNKSDMELQPIISEETARRIVRFVAQKDEQVPLEEVEAVPPILSLLCRELNERRFSQSTHGSWKPAEQITFREGEADIETIIAAFYERSLTGRPEAVRIFIEEELVSYSGARLAQDEKSILRVFEEGYHIRGVVRDWRAAGFGDSSAARECLEHLVNERLLSSLGGGENPSYELIHDLLAAVVAKSRAVREERREKEEAARLAGEARDAAKQAERLARRARRTVITVTVSLVFALGAAATVFLQYGKANAARVRAENERQVAESARARATMAEKEAKVAAQRATVARQSAEQLIDFMIVDLRSSLQQLGRLDLADAINTRVQAYYYSVAGEDESTEVLAQRFAKLRNQADALHSQGDFAGALESYRASTEIAEKLAIQDPTNVDWQCDLAWSYWNTGRLLAKVEPQSIKEALAMVHKGRDLLRLWQERGYLTAEQQKWLVSIEADLKEMER